ncbi:MFS transporter [Roseococcus sp. YIM B11640]|uniref:MFS transporter n=1 Tax=Roseococcus sp. YIM B11640 TaxID=3133973 RepID=UPI003C79D79F
MSEAQPPARPVGIWLLALASFASAAGMRIMDPLMPLVAADFGVTVSSIAVIVAAFMLFYGSGQVATGPLGDRLGKLRVAGCALLLFGSFTVLAQLSTSVTQLTILRACSGLVAGAIIPLLLAHIGDTVPYSDRQAVIGQFLIGNVMAQLVTGPISGVIGQHFGWQASYLCFGIFTIGVGLTVAVRLGPQMWQKAPGGGRGQSGFLAYARLLRNPSARKLLLGAFLDGALLFGGAFPFIASYLIEEFSLEAGEAGLVVACFGLGALAYTRLARRMVGRFGETGLLLWGGIGLALGLAATAAAPFWGLVLAVQLLLGFCFYSFHGVLQARATEAMPEARGTSVSAFAMSLFLGQTAGSLVFAGVIATGGYRWAFGIAAAGMIIFARWVSRVSRP